VRQHPAAEEFLELGTDERRQPDPIGPRLDGRDKFAEMRAHEAVEHARRRRARHVDTTHAPPGGNDLLHTNARGVRAGGLLRTSSGGIAGD